MKPRILIVLFLLIVVYELRAQNTRLSNSEFFIMGVIELNEPIFVYKLNRDKKSIECGGIVTEKNNLEVMSQKGDAIEYSIFDTNCYAILHSSHFVYDYLLPIVDEDLGLLLKNTYPNEILTNIKLLSDINRYNYNKKIKYFYITSRKFLVVLLKASIYNQYIPLGGGCLYFINEKTYKGIYFKVLIPLLG